jgi:hypothetical protein
MLIVDDLLMLPAKGLLGVFKAIYEQAYEEMYDPSKVQEQLMALQMQFEMDEITQEEYEARESELLDRLDQIYEQELDRREAYEDPPVNRG